MRKGRVGVLPLTILLCFGFVVYYILSRQMIDSTAPEISFPSETLEVSVGVTDEELLYGVTAFDAKDGDVSAGIVVEGITNLSSDQLATVTYAAFDQAGNVGKAQRTVHYTDYHSPRFTLSAALVFRSGTNFDVLNYVGAQDVIDGALDDRVKATLVSGEDTITTEGVHDVEFRVTNSMKDTAYLTVPVEVYPSGTYNATLELSDYLVYVKQGSTFQRDSYLKTLRAGTQEIAINSSSEDFSISYDSDVNTNVPGTYSVSYTVRYRGYTGYTRLIVVVEE